MATNSRKPLRLICIAALPLLIPFAMHAQTVDEVLKKHYKAIGQDKVAKAQTAMVKGVFTLMKRPGNFTLYIKRPDMLRNDGMFVSAAMVTVIKGTKGYMAVAGQPATEVPIRDLKNQLKYSSIDDPLYEAQQNGATITYEGKERRSQKDVYKLKAKYTNSDSMMAFIDARTNYLLTTLFYQNAPSTKAGRTDKTYSEYRPISKGIVMPFKIEISSFIEQMEANYTINIYEYKLDLILLDRLFDKP